MASLKVLDGIPEEVILEAVGLHLRDQVNASQVKAASACKALNHLLRNNEDGASLEELVASISATARTLSIISTELTLLTTRKTAVDAEREKVAAAAVVEVKR